MQFTTASTKFGVVAALLMALAVNGVAATKSTDTEVERKYSPSDKLYTPSLRRVQESVPVVVSTPEECACTASKNGLGFIEILYTGPHTPEVNYTQTIIDSMRVFDNRGSRPELYSANYTDCCTDFTDAGAGGSWRVDSAGNFFFTFDFPSNVKKITQTAFHFCIDDVDGGESVCSSADSDCGFSNVYVPNDSKSYDPTNNTCYYWDVHTSCSVYLIGEEILIKSVPYFEVTSWGDDNRICEWIILCRILLPYLYV